MLTCNSNSAYVNVYLLIMPKHYIWYQGLGCTAVGIADRQLTAVAIAQTMDLEPARVRSIITGTYIHFTSMEQTLFCG